MHVDGFPGPVLACEPLQFCLPLLSPLLPLPSLLFLHQLTDPSGTTHSFNQEPYFRHSFVKSVSSPHQTFFPKKRFGFQLSLVYCHSFNFYIHSFWGSLSACLVPRWKLLLPGLSPSASIAGYNFGFGTLSAPTFSVAVLYIYVYQHIYIQRSVANLSSDPRGSSYPLDSCLSSSSGHSYSSSAV